MSIALQTCLACGTAQYPSRDVCRACLSDTLEQRETAVAGRVVAEAQLHRSLEPDRLGDVPLRIGTVATDMGIRIIVALAPGIGPFAQVRLFSSDGPAGPILAVPSHQSDMVETSGAEIIHDQ